MALIRLPTVQILEIAGIDAVAFAQSQFCNDVTLLTPDAWQWNAWLNPQGRVRWFFHLLRLGEDRLLAVLRGGSAGEFKTALQPYVFRSKLVLAIHDNWQSYGAIGNDSMAELASQIFAGIPPKAHEIIRKDAFCGIRLSGDPARLLAFGVNNSGIPGAIADPSAIEFWRRQDVLAGLVELDPGSSAQFLPQTLGFERINAISFRKGCYPGQEVVARLHFKGGNKRGLYRIEFAGAKPEPGTAILAAQEPDQIAGMLLNGAETEKEGCVCLAALRDELTDSQLTLETNKLIYLKINNFIK